MVIGEGSFGRGERYPRKIGTRQWKGTASFVHAEVTPTYDDVEIEERRGKATERTGRLVSL